MPNIDNSDEVEITQDSPTVETTPSEAGEATAETTEPQVEEPKEEDDPKVIRWKQQLHGREAQAQAAEEKAAKLENLLVKNLVEKVEQDNGVLISLFQEDPELAEKVAKNFGGLSAKEAVAKIQAARTGEPLPPKNTVDKDELFKEFESRWEAKQTEKQISETTEKLFSKVPGELIDTVKDKYNSLKGIKNLSVQEATELAEWAIYSVTKDIKKSQEKEKAILNLSSTTLQSTTSERPKSKAKVAGADELAKSMGLHDLYN